MISMLAMLAVFQHVSVTPPSPPHTERDRAAQWFWVGGVWNSNKLSDYRR